MRTVVDKCWLLALDISIAALCFSIGIGVVTWFGSAEPTKCQVREEAPVFISPVKKAVHNQTEDRNYDYSLSCSDRILKPIWAVLLRSKYFRESLSNSQQGTSCVEVLDRMEVDLNADGTHEILVWGRIFPLCGAVGNCEFWIFSRTRGKYRTLLHADDHVDRSHLGEQVKRSRTNGYSDIQLLGHFSAMETSFTTYKFDGRRYQESRCYYEVPQHNGEADPGWHFVSCKEFYEQCKKLN